MEYSEVNYKTPNAFKNVHPNQSALIIGTGPSTEELVKYKDKLKDKFDIIIGLNFATNDFEDILDYHVILEKNPARAYTEMKQFPDKFSKAIPRILNWKTLHRFPKDLNIYKATRANFKLKPDITKYKHNGEEGLLIGPAGGKRGLSSGTVVSNAIHFACIMGIKDIYLAGADLVFKGQFDHYYPDNNFYRKSKTKIANRSPIVKVQHKGKEHETTELFRDSARFVNEIVKTQCTPRGINVYDFSDGLISEAKELDMGDFFKKC